MRLGHAGVRIQDQDTAAQLTALKAANCDRLLRERASGAHFQSLTEAIETTTPVGRMMMHLVGKFAKFEHSLLKGGTRVGSDEARKAGRVGGRRPKLTQAQQQEVIALVASGQKSTANAARLFRAHSATVSKLFARHRAQPLD